MRSHVFAVWDFMALLKRLQIDLTCTTVPWLPGKDPLAARFINEIVLGEECDVVTPGTPPISHYQLYLGAMKELDADTKPIEILIDKLIKNGGKIYEALEFTKKQYGGYIPQNTFDFVRKTFDICDSKPVHEVAAYFLYGREDPIPEMFQSLLGTLESSNVSCEKLKLYLKRHIEVDSEDHAPLVAKLMKHLCNVDETKWEQATKSAIHAIEQRIILWDGILNEIQSSSR